MSILSHDRFWDALISLPTTKKMLNLSLKKCSHCGRTILEAALDDYVVKLTPSATNAAAFIHL